MLQANLVKPERVILEEVEIPSVRENEVLIKVKYCGICGSDIHSYKGKHPFVHPPIVLGHEFSGIISQTGKKVKNFHKEERVSVEPNIVCGKCYNCLHGRYNICNYLKVIGCVGYNGAFAQYIAVPQNKVIKLPREISFEEGALIEPTAVAVHAVRKSKQKIGDKVLILGAGPIGLLIMQVAKVSGAGEIIITDLLDYRLKKAKELGADKIVNSVSRDLVEFIRETYGENGIDLIYECVGREETLSEAIQIARKGTKIMIVGVPEENPRVNLAYIGDRELELIGSLMYIRDDFEEAIDLIQKKKIQVQPLITHSFKLKDIKKAFELILKKKENVMKVLIEI